jgi:hypothetical protein
MPMRKRPERTRAPTDFDARCSAHRLSAQRIARGAFKAAHEVVSWLGAVQAQDYAGAKWALGVRLVEGATDETIERALSEGSILRTHALRGTWHFVSAEDIHWMLGLIAPRVVARCASRYRELELDARTFRRSNTVICKALSGGRHLTRTELGAALRDARIATTGERLTHLLHRAELDALICSGATRGKQRTYALLDERVPRPKARPLRDEAMAELARRYFQSRGPATVADFMWWSGLSASDARSALMSVKSSLVADVAGGTTYWRTGRPVAPARSPSAALLPPFDEYLVAYRDRGAVLDPKHARRVNDGGGMLNASLIVDGRVCGTWRRVLSKNAVSVEVDAFDPPTSRTKRAIVAAARRYGAFLELDAVLDVR